MTIPVHLTTSPEVKFLQLGRPNLPQTKRLALIIKPEAVRLGHAVQILQAIHEGLQKAGLKYRFGPMLLIDPSAEFIDALYYEHSGVDLGRYGLESPGTKEAKDWYSKLLAPFMKGKVIASPILAVMLEVTSSDRQAISTLRDIVGATNPIAAVRNTPSSAAQEREKVRHQFSTGRGARLSPIPGSDGETPLYTRIHCPASPEEAAIQLRVIFRPEDLAYHYDGAAIKEILGGSPLSIPRTAVPLTDLLGKEPNQAAKELKANFRTLQDTSLYDVELLVRELTSLLPTIQASEDRLAASLGIPYDYVPVPPQVSTDEPAHLYVVVGPRGSGKTTTAKMLLEDGSISAVIPPYVHLGGSPGPEETALSEQQALDLFGQNAFLTAQLGPGGWYLFARSSMEGFASYHGGRALVFAGSGHARDLQLWAETQGNVVVHTALLNISEAALKERLSHRKRDGDAEYAHHIQAICRGLQADAHLFEHVIDAEGPPETVAARYRTWFEAAEAGEVTPKPLPDQGNPSAQKRFVQILLSKILVDILFHILQTESFTTTTKKGKQRLLTVDELEVFFRDKTLPWFTTFYEEGYRAVHGSIPEDKALDRIDKLTDHAHWFLVSAWQALLHFRDPKVFDDPASVHKVGPLRFLAKIGATGRDTEKMRKNYQRMAGIFKKLIPAEVFLWAIAHDLGKLDGLHFHDARVANLLDEFGVLEEFADSFSEFRKGKMLAMTRAVLKHHHRIGLSYVPSYSFSFAKMLFKDPETLALIWDGGNWDLAAAEKLMRKLLQIAILDISGGSLEGNLTNTCLDILFRAHDQIIAELRSASDPEALMARLDEIARAETEERISLALAFNDEEIDQRVPGYHANILREAVKRAVTDGTITEADWQTVLEHSYRTQETQYFLMDNLSQMQEDGKLMVFAEGAEQGWVNPAFLKFQVIRAKVAEYAHAQFGKNNMAMSFVDHNGELLFQYEMQNELNSILLEASPSPVFEGQTAYLVDGQGRKIDSLRINIITEDNHYGDPELAHLQIQFLDKLS